MNPSSATTSLQPAITNLADADARIQYLLLVSIGRELAAACPPVAEFLSTGEAERVFFIDGHACGPDQASFLRWESADESCAGRFLAVDGSGQWEFGFRGNGERGVAEYRGETLPPYHLGRMAALRDMGVPRVLALRGIGRMDRQFRGPLWRTRYVRFCSVVFAASSLCFNLLPFTAGSNPHHWANLLVLLRPLVLFACLYYLIFFGPVLIQSARAQRRGGKPSVRAV